MKITENEPLKICDFFGGIHNIIWIFARIKSILLLVNATHTNISGRSVHYFWSYPKLRQADKRMNP